MAQSSATTVLPEVRGRAGGDQGAFSRLARGVGRFARRRKLGAFGSLLVVLIMVLALLSPLIQRYGDNQVFEVPNPEFNPTANPLAIAQNPRLSTPTNFERYQSPNTRHWFGTDQFARDIYARIIVGARLAVIIGIGASLIAVTAGTVIGVVSGYFGGGVDIIVQRFVDALQAFPGLVLLMLIVQVVNQPPLALTVAALGLLGWATSVRIVRSAVLALKNTPFVEAARSFGATDMRIMLQHVLPNVFAPVIVVFSISIGAYILAEASLSFLGLGPADKTTWGKMVNAGRVALDLHPWEALFAGVAITLTVLGFNLAGDALRDELDPRLRGR
jgi:peptide/nickel transport system permease protein